MSGGNLRFDSAGRTDVGKVRALNEDRYVDRPLIALWAVADGMGGHQAGEVASGMLADALEAIGPPDSGYAYLDGVQDAVERVNRALVAHAAISTPGSVIGSTIVVLIAYAGHYACLWAGDSRVYLLRDKRLEQITRDHSMVQELLDSGALARRDVKNFGKSNIITRAVGVNDRLALDLHQGPILDGDVFLLCSDGLTNFVDDAEIAAELRRPARDAAESLIALTLSRAAKDNVTVVVVRAFADADSTLDPLRNR
ncbi:protein phosphatase 2C domain-containing protein [Polymorphobacter sp. PAMC 29334]|uniref:PP2C family protein-serine/threonine phosphatase n=1 Tax=Polymorphobacter sp. PAMC 29334 TaxID=2862331 RepID=UPI001C75DB35|nr:protein phosphatase 2C domain-containing protein [Polymorphobacter sp. PAMC 29334]QYE35370.1 protein phosphatase 2C domain-containing protein [Polymorphobacter sp. PAMC 29334]